jgi:hypothetical protein
MGLFTREDISTLAARTEGWIVGLQMASLSMQGLTDRPAFIQALHGTHRYILEYLIEEVLDRQPESLRDFLLQTSILDRLCAPLCDALLEDQRGSQDILELLYRSNLFLTLWSGLLVSLSPSLRRFITRPIAAISAGKACHPAFACQPMVRACGPF